MRRLLGTAALFFLAAASLAAPTLRAQTGSPQATSPFPPQVELRVPFAPTAFPGAGLTYVAYELYITNHSYGPVTLRQVEVFDAEKKAVNPIATLEGKQLRGLLMPAGGAPIADGGSDPIQLSAGATIIAFMWVSFEKGAPVPGTLRHRVHLTESFVEGAPISTHNTQLQVFGPPLTGGDWLASDGPSNELDNHHRRGVLILDGRPVISRRYAIDWKQVKADASFSGDPRDKRAYYSYGKPVLAVADATVLEAQDGLPDNVPGHGEAFHPSVPITLDNVGGNHIVLDLGSGQYAWYFHLQPNTLRVKRGEHVRKGQLLAQIGCSGDAREPHLHFEVTTSAKVLAGDGVPYVIDRYRISSQGNAGQVRVRELPLDRELVDFGGGAP